jgi:hypothetical protein
VRAQRYNCGSYDSAYLTEVIGGAGRVDAVLAGPAEVDGFLRCVLASDRVEPKRGCPDGVERGRCHEDVASTTGDVLADVAGRYARDGPLSGRLPTGASLASVLSMAKAR